MSAILDDDRFVQRVFEYLDDLRESGDTNMFGAGPYIVREFEVSRAESHELLKKWMDTFGERHAVKS